MLHSRNHMSVPLAGVTMEIGNREMRLCYVSKKCIKPAYLESNQSTAFAPVIKPVSAKRSRPRNPPAETRSILAWAAPSAPLSGAAFAELRGARNNVAFKLPLLRATALNLAMCHVWPARTGPIVLDTGVSACLGMAGMASCWSVLHLSLEPGQGPTSGFTCIFTRTCVLATAIKGACSCSVDR